MFVPPPIPKSNVIPLHPQKKLDELAAANRERLEREDRRVLMSTAFAFAVMFAFAFAIAALLVFSERRDAALSPAAPTRSFHGR